MHEYDKQPHPDTSLAIQSVTFRHQDIANVVDDFYNRIQLDPLLKVAFQSVHDWPEHIQRLTHFWWIRFGGEPYMRAQYNPVLKHFFAGFNEELLARWLGIFAVTLQENLNKEQADLWTQISERMGQMLLIRNNLFSEDQNGN